MGFVRFADKGRGHAPRASISPSGLIGLNRGTLRKFRLDQYKYCVLYYDADTQRIGIELTTDESAEGARSLRIRHPGGTEASGADISAKGFLDYFDVGVTATTVYPIVRDADSGLLAIRLSEGKARRKRERSGKLGSGDRKP